MHTNLVYLDIDPDHGLARPDSDGAPGIVSRLAAEGVLITGGAHRMRAALHLDVSDDDLAQAIAVFQRITT